MVGDLIVSQIPMLTAWELNTGVNGAHELVTPGKLCCSIKRRNQGKTDGRKLLESEQIDRCWGGMAPMGSVVLMASMSAMATMDHVAAMAAMEWCCRVVKELRWLRSLASKETEKIMGTRWRMTTAPRVSDGSRSLRRMDKIDGERVEGLSYKIVGEHVVGLSRRKVVKNEMKDSQMLVEKCRCRKTNCRHLVSVERSRMVGGYDGVDGYDRYDAVDGVDGCGGRDGFEGCGGADWGCS